jgi:hypothetical protein
MKNMRCILEVVAASDLKGIQQKLNTWMTTDLLVKFDVTPLADGSMLFRILLKKEA